MAERKIQAGFNNDEFQNVIQNILNSPDKKGLIFLSAWIADQLQQQSPDKIEPSVLEKESLIAE